MPSRSLEPWQKILRGKMSLREKIWDLKIATEDLKTHALLFEAMYALESAVEYAQAQVKERGGEVPTCTCGQAKDRSFTGGNVTSGSFHSKRAGTPDPELT